MANILKIGNRVLKIGGRILRGDSGSAPVDPYNPLGLPPFTIRCKFSSGYTPTQGDSQTLVDAGENVWDITRNSTNWDHLLATSEDDGGSYLLEVLGANTTGVTYMGSMFYMDYNLTSVALFDTSSVTNMMDMFKDCAFSSIPLFDTSSCGYMAGMFDGCGELTHIPLFDTSSAYQVDKLFYQCYNVQSGAFELYQQMSTQANPPSNHWQTFTDCGNNELIPIDWKEPDEEPDDDEEEDYGDDEE